MYRRDSSMYGSAFLGSSLTAASNSSFARSCSPLDASALPWVSASSKLDGITSTTTGVSAAGTVVTATAAAVGASGTTLGRFSTQDVCAADFGSAVGFSRSPPQAATD